MYVLEVRNYTQNRHFADILKYLAALVKQTQVSAELVDYYAFYKLLVIGSLESYRSVCACKNSSPINIGHKDYACPGVSGHRHIHQIRVTQVYFRYAACTLHHYRVVAVAQAIKGSIHLLAEHLTTFIPAEIIIRSHITDSLPVKHHLRCMVRAGFEQQRVHIGVAGNAGSLSLNGLRATYLQAIGSGVRVERHILRLEGSRAVAVLTEYTAQGSSYHALANIAARSGQHHRM